MSDEIAYCSVAVGTSTLCYLSPLRFGLYFSNSNFVYLAISSTLSFSSFSVGRLIAFDSTILLEIATAGGDDVPSLTSLTKFRSFNAIDDIN